MRAEVEAAVLLAGVGDLLGAVALGEHDQRAAVRLEQRRRKQSMRPGGGRAERAGGVALGRFGGAGVVDRVVLQVSRQAFAGDRVAP
jgi:hypothetical protein